MLYSARWIRWIPFRDHPEILKHLRQLPWPDVDKLFDLWMSDPAWIDNSDSIEIFVEKRGK